MTRKFRLLLARKVNHAKRLRSSMPKMLILASILLIGLCGCANDADTSEQRESVPNTIPQLETCTVPATTEYVSENTYILSREWDPAQLCLRFQPTTEVSSGEDARYFTPSNQSEWINAFEEALSKADSAQHWEPTDSSTGIWIRYKEHWWNLLTNGEILTIGSGRISAGDSAQIYEMCMAAAKELNMAEPVRPYQIKNIKSATLDYDDIYTITDPKKLRILEQWFSNSTEIYGGANCWFTALLTLNLENGDVLTISIATDSCCAWLSEGVFYDYGAGDNTKFFSLFTEEDTAASPEPNDFVRICDYIPNVDVSLAYATTDNFTQETIYDFSDAYLRYGTLQKLIKVCEELNEHNLTLRIWDAYRPISAQARLWEACPDPAYVSPPDTGNRTHCRGSAVDVTLLTLDGNEVEMPSGFDDFTAKGDRDYSDCSDATATNAELLQNIMEKHGFNGYSGEWWHYTDSESYPIEETFKPVKASWYYADCNEFISLRSGASTSAETLLRIPVNDKVYVLAECGKFAFVSYNGLQGYVLKSYIQPVDNSLSPDEPDM